MTKKAVEDVRLEISPPNMQTASRAIEGVLLLQHPLSLLIVITMLSTPDAVIVVGVDFCVFSHFFMKKHM